MPYGGRERADAFGQYGLRQHRVDGGGVHTSRFVDRGETKTIIIGIL